MPFAKRHRASEEDEDVAEGDKAETRVVSEYKDTIFYRGDIDQQHATQFVIKLRELADRLRDNGGAPVITLHLTTGGGDVFAGLVMYEAIRHCPVTVHVVCDACVCSAGTIVALGGTRRLMYSSGVLLIHSLSSWMGGMHKPKEIRQELVNCETLMSILTDIYRKHSRLTKAALAKLYDTDLYLRSSECLKLGFVDEVIA